MKQSHKTLLLWVLLILMFLAIWQFLQSDGTKAAPVAFSDFMAQVHAKPDEPHVEKVTIKQPRVHLRGLRPERQDAQKEVSPWAPRRTTQLTKDLVDHGVKVDLREGRADPVLVEHAHHACSRWSSCW